MLGALYFSSPPMSMSAPSVTILPFTNLALITVLFPSVPTDLIGSNLAPSSINLLEPSNRVVLNVVSSP